jgi:hypothetical protein
VRYLVFVQRTRLDVDLAGIVANAHRYFEAEVNVLDASSPDGGATAELARLELSSARHGFRARFEVSARASTDDDFRRADAAEIAGRAAGMATLARRCRVIWDIRPDEPADPRATLNLCALLASVALGPVLPPDGATLLGVRSSMKRLERLLHPPDQNE